MPTLYSRSSTSSCLRHSKPYQIHSGLSVGISHSFCLSSSNKCTLFLWQWTSWLEERTSTSTSFSSYRKLRFSFLINKLAWLGNKRHRTNAILFKWPQNSEGLVWYYIEKVILFNYVFIFLKAHELCRRRRHKPN
jgi:hypothetical protein